MLVDTGVGHTLIFDSHKAQQLGFNQAEPYLLRGLGEQPALEAHQVSIDQLSIGDFHLTILTALVLTRKRIHLKQTGRGSYRWNYWLRIIRTLPYFD